MCIFLDVWNYFVDQLNLTPYSVYLLILVEFILIIIFAFLPDISYKLTSGGESFLLVDNVKYLDKQQIIANSDLLKIPKDIKNPNSVSSNDNYYRNYCISMWVFVNNHSSTKQSYNLESEILFGANILAKSQITFPWNLSIKVSNIFFKIPV